MSSTTPVPPVSASNTPAQGPIVASPTLLSRIETLIAKVEAAGKSDLTRIESTVSSIPQVEAAATKYWMAIAGILVGMVADHLLKFL